jgi:hypothetical protein
MPTPFAGMVVQFILFLAIDFGINLLQQRQRGLWKRFRAAPLSPAVLLGSRVVSAAIISFFVIVVNFLFARLIFGVRVEGSMAGFLGVSAAFALMTASFGLLVATLGKTPEATRGLAIFATLLAVMLGAWIPMFFVSPMAAEGDAGHANEVGCGRPGSDDLARIGPERSPRAHGGAACIRAGLQLDRRDALPLGGRGIVERAARFSLHDYCVLMNFSTTPLSSAT